MERVKKPCGETCKPYQLVLMDIQMPVMDGYEATRILKDRMCKGEIPNVPIVACTAFVQNGNRNEAKEAGMDDVCNKPLYKEKIEHILKKFNVI